MGSDLKIIVSMVPNAEQLAYIQRHQWQTMELKDLAAVTLEQIMAQQLSIRGKVSCNGLDRQLPHTHTHTRQANTHPRQANTHPRQANTHPRHANTNPYTLRT